MRHLFLSGYTIVWGPLPEESLAAEAARAFHISHFSSLKETETGPWDAVITCGMDIFPPPESHVPVYRAEEQARESLLEKIDEGKL